MADVLDHLRDYGVSEGFKSVHPVGNPMSHSTHVGFNAPPVAACKFSAPCLLGPDPAPVWQFAWGVGHVFTAQFRASQLRRICDAEPLFFASFTVGVGHDPRAVPLVRGANVGSWYAIPADIIPERGQVSENSAKPSARPFRRATEQCCDVLHDDDARSNFANQTGDFGPEAGSRVIGNACLFSGNADVLAGKPSCDAVNGNSVCGEAQAGECSNVVILRNSGPVLRQNLARKRLDFTERDGLEAAGALKAKAETAYAGKQIEDAQFVKSPDR
jgi:hypothetical protein